MRISEQIKLTVNRFADIVESDDDAKKRFATGMLTTREAEKLYNEYRLLHGEPPRWMIPASWRVGGRDRMGEDLSAFIISGATHVFSIENLPDVFRNKMWKTVSSKVFKDKIEAWSHHLQSLEKVGGYYARAADDVRRALTEVVSKPGIDDESVCLILRLALFRPLGVLQERIDDGAIYVHPSETESLQELFRAFMIELKAIVSSVMKGQPCEVSVMFDPLLGMNEVQIAEMATADYRISEALDLKPELNNGKDDELIDSARHAVWRIAIETSDALKDEILAVEKYGGLVGEVLRDWLRAFDLIIEYEKIDRPCLDLIDFALLASDAVGSYVNKMMLYHVGPDEPAVVGEAIADFLQSRVDEALPEIWRALTERHGLRGGYDEVRSNFKVDVKKYMGEECPSMSIERLRYLNERHKSKWTVTKRYCSEIAYDIFRRDTGASAEWCNIGELLGWVSKHLKGEVIDEEFAVSIMRIIYGNGLLEASWGNGFLQGLFMEQLLDPDGSYKNAISSQRAAFIASVTTWAGDDPQFIYEMVRGRFIWSDVRRRYISDIEITLRTANLLFESLDELEGRNANKVWENLALYRTLKETFSKGVPSRAFADHVLSDLESRVREADSAVGILLKKKFEAALAEEFGPFPEVEIVRDDNEEGDRLPEDQKDVAGGGTSTSGSSAPPLSRGPGGINHHKAIDLTAVDPAYDFAIPQNAALMTSGALFAIAALPVTI